MDLECGRQTEGACGAIWLGSNLGIWLVYIRAWKTEESREHSIPDMWARSLKSYHQLQMHTKLNFNTWHTLIYICNRRPILCIIQWSPNGHCHTCGMAIEWNTGTHSNTHTCTRTRARTHTHTHARTNVCKHTFYYVDEDYCVANTLSNFSLQCNTLIWPQLDISEIMSLPNVIAIAKNSILNCCTTPTSMCKNWDFLI